MDITVIDTETTGLDPAVDEIVEVAFVRVDLRLNCTAESCGAPEVQMRASGSTLVKPLSASAATGTAFNGITDDMLLDVDPWVDSWLIAECRKIIQSESTLCAWHWPFDGAFLVAADQYDGQLGRSWLRRDVLDPRVWAKELWPGESSSLEAVARRLGQEQPRPHRALSDAQLLAGLLPVLIHKVKVRWGPATIAELLGWQHEAVGRQVEPRSPSWPDWLRRIELEVPSAGWRAR